MHDFPDCLQPSEAQIETILRLFPDCKEDKKEEIIESLLVEGFASISYVKEFRVPSGSRMIDMTMMSGCEQACFLAPLESEEDEDERLLIRFERRFRRFRKDCNGDPIADVDVYTYPLESRPEVEAALYDQIASGYLARLIDDLGAYCPPDECARFIRSALEAGPIGAAWKAGEAARRIQSSIEDEMPEKRVSSVIRKNGA